MKVDISIIVPVYNGEDCISETLNSLVTQTFKNFEVIIVNDGSIDNTHEIVSNFCSKDDRFKFFNKENGGVASARNFGLTKSKGKFIIHHDAGDTRPPDSLEILYKRIIETNSDIVFGDYLVANEKLANRVSQSFSGNYMDFIQGVLNDKYHAGLWNKLIKSELYRGIQFEEDVNYMEDMLLLVKMMSNNPKISYIPEIVYHYVQSGTSLTNNFTKKTLNQTKEVVNLIEEEFANKQYTLDLTTLKLNYKLKAIISSLSINHKTEFPEVNSLIFSNKYLAIKYKVLLFFESKGIRWISIFYNFIKK